MSRLIVERTRHWRTCPECSGDGFVTASDSSIGDPQCERDEDCPNRDCYEGVVEVWTDPLVAMSFARRMPWAYRIARDRAMKPVTLPGRAPKPETYIERLRRTDPMVAEVVGPVIDGMFAMARLAA